MAGDWVAWTKGLERKSEVIRIAAKLSELPLLSAARCVLVWSWADDQIGEECVRDDKTGFVRLSPNPGDNARFIDQLGGLLGFADAMASEGWIKFRHDLIEFPNFARWNTETAKTRLRNSKNQQRNANDRSPIRAPARMMTSLECHRIAVTNR